MTTPLVRIIRIGGHISVQDRGRRHAMQYGVSESGAADIHASLWANRLLGLSMDSPVFEITLGNVELEFLTDCQLALTGADMQATSEQRSFPTWCTHQVRRGERLAFGFPKAGLRAYLAVNAVLELPRLYRSVCEVARESLPGTQSCSVGSEFNALGINQAVPTRHVPQRFIPNYEKALQVDVMLGYQAQQFSQSEIDRFFSADYQIRSESSRMAYRLTGPKVNHDIQALYSEGVAYGAIQIPPDGQPVVLLNDRQTMGGYPKIGCVTRVSGSALTQRRPGTFVTFRRIDYPQARRQWAELLTFFDNL